MTHDFFEISTETQEETYVRLVGSLVTQKKVKNQDTEADISHLFQLTSHYCLREEIQLISRSLIIQFSPYGFI